MRNILFLLIFLTACRHTATTPVRHHHSRHHGVVEASEQATPQTNLQIVYNEAQNITIVLSQDIILNNGSVLVNVMASYPGRKINKMPNIVGLTFITRGRNYPNKVLMLNTITEMFFRTETIQDTNTNFQIAPVPSDTFQEFIRDPNSALIGFLGSESDYIRIELTPENVESFRAFFVELQRHVELEQIQGHRAE